MSLLILGIILVVISVGIQYIDQGVVINGDLNGYATFVGGIGVTLILIGVVVFLIFGAFTSLVGAIAALKD